MRNLIAMTVLLLNLTGCHGVGKVLSAYNEIRGNHKAPKIVSYKYDSRGVFWVELDKEAESLYAQARNNITEKKSTRKINLHIVQMGEKSYVVVLGRHQVDQLGGVAHVTFELNSTCYSYMSMPPGWGSGYDFINSIVHRKQSFLVTNSSFKHLGWTKTDGYDPY